MDEEEIEQIYGWQRAKPIQKPPVMQILKTNEEKYTPEVALECLRQMREMIALSNPYKTLGDDPKVRNN